MECFLAEGELIRLDGSREGMVLRCLGGTLWLTKGDGVDYLIPSGGRVMLAKDESALVEALEAAELILGRPQSAGKLIRPAMSLAGC